MRVAPNTSIRKQFATFQAEFRTEGVGDEKIPLEKYHDDNNNYVTKSRKRQLGRRENRLVKKLTSLFSKIQVLLFSFWTDLHSVGDIVPKKIFWVCLTGNSKFHHPSFSIHQWRYQPGIYPDHREISPYYGENNYSAITVTFNQIIVNEILIDLNNDGGFWACLSLRKKVFIIKTKRNKFNWNVNVTL